MEFSKAVIETEEFQNFCSENLIFEQVDFPQKTKGISKGELARRDSLAELYNREGEFPKLVLIDPTGPRQFGILHHNRNTSSIIKSIESHNLKNNHNEVRKLMGSVFTVDLCGGDSIYLKESWELLYDLEAQISSWNDSSEVSEINRNAGKKAVVVSQAVYDLLKLSKSISSLTQGSFDVTIGPALQVWNWKKGEIPNELTVDSVKLLVGYEMMELNDSNKSVFLKLPGMRIDLGAVGKGYACEKVLEFWEKKGVKNGVISAGGDLYVKGKNCSGKNWDVAIRHPSEKNNIIYSLKESDISVATSGDYERFFEINSVRYSHILNPRTCYPTKGITSVTIFSDKAILADAFATSLSVMGVDKGIHMIDQMEGIEAIIIETNGEVHFSKGVQNK